MTDRHASPFVFLEGRSPREISALIMRESDRVCAAVLARLPKVLAVQALADFSPSRKQELLTLMKTSAELPPDILQAMAADLRARVGKPAPAAASASTPPAAPPATSPATAASSAQAAASAKAAPARVPTAFAPSAQSPDRAPSRPAPTAGTAPRAAQATEAALPGGRFGAVLAAAKKTEEKPLAAPPPSGKKVSYGGLHIAAAILRLAGSSVRRNLKKEDPALFRQLVRHMYTFDDLVEVDDAGLQTLLAEMDTRIVAFSLKAASPRLRGRFLRNMSTRRAAEVDRELEGMQRVRLSDIESAQDTVIKTALALQERGRLLIDRDADVV